MPKSIKRIAKEQIECWVGLSPPNTMADTFVEGFVGAIEGYEKLRGQLEFEDEPSSFEAALEETKEPSP
jgi:hypothetical protein